MQRAEVEWYGLSVDEAIEKNKQLKESSVTYVPLKVQFRTELTEELKLEKDSPGESTKIEESKISTA